MNITKQKGTITELQCELAFCNLGILLSKPIIEDSRYDYIADLDGNLIRIQCKTCSIGENGDYIQFATRSMQINTRSKKTKKYSKKDIDYFYTYYNNVSYLIPVEECSNDKRLHFKNVKHKNMSQASDYELIHILKTKEGFYNFQSSEINIIKKDVSTNTCIDCGRIISYKATRCKDCSDNNKRLESNRICPTKEELERLIIQMPMTQIGNLYGMTDNGIRKCCKKYGLPYTKQNIKRMKTKEN